MEGCNKLKDCVENGEAGFDIGSGTDFPIEKCSFDPDKERLRSVFDQVLFKFMKEISADKCLRPFPAFSSDGQLVDLFKLFWVVRKVGGYDNITKKNLWGFVSEECGLSYGASSSIKLICKKYLKELDEWLGLGLSGKCLDEKKSDVVRKLDLLAQELETESRKNDNQKNSNFLEHRKDRNSIHIDAQGIGGQVKNRKTCKQEQKSSGSLCADEKNRHEDDVCSDNSFSSSSDKKMEMPEYKFGGFNPVTLNDSGQFLGNHLALAKKGRKKVVNRVHICEERAAENVKYYSVEHNTNLVLTEKFVAKTQNLLDNVNEEEKRFNALNCKDIVVGTDLTRDFLDTRKRKQEFQPLVAMRDWLIDVARQSDNPGVGLIPDYSNWKNYGNEDFWAQVLLVRDALSIRKDADANGCEHLITGLNKKLKMLPSMYEDSILIHPSTEKLRCSGRLHSLAKPCMSTCCKLEASRENIFKIQEVQTDNCLNGEIKPATRSIEDHDKSIDILAEKQVPIGPLFQAEVPEWTNEPVESDSKWIGTRMWPHVDRKYTVSSDPIGKGCSHSCRCPFPGSVECVRFHIAEKRFELKLEIGKLFYHWRFDSMGEEVSLSWTKDEERIFKDMMRLYAPSPNKFWNNRHRFLPSKTRQKMVSFYFNIFLVQRRSYQNRVTPKEIDSDNDEKECGSIGDSFGYKALNLHSSKLIMCLENMESTQLL